jgi:hypothetical protein
VQGGNRIAVLLLVCRIVVALQLLKKGMALCWQRSFPGKRRGVTHMQLDEDAACPGRTLVALTPVL